MVIESLLTERELNVITHLYIDSVIEYDIRQKPIHLKLYMWLLATKYYNEIHLFILGDRGGGNPDEVNRHLALGGEFLARGELQEALSHFHAAVGELNNIRYIYIYIT